ncbi:putative GTP pyrophosphokinase [Virgibacillus natechei]|uniref:GTP pyrophosphokinase n=1 Tax=Virgibacillus natechei TaxID=1216297 RepID=A0ABS4IJH9_9BACI|nr:GTP pyrophosphokinase family protein [Virgibacillus natechei]MBP1971084.1 putative GTP pyrophosphokinase [Virgibacillus natechei]UZD14820.1 GTP pyrophosphokinase family protein [Virgibacillus natechei]
MEMNQVQLKELRQIRHEMKRFMMIYKFGLDEMNTKLNILKEEFQNVHEYNPIEHIKSRIKTPESIMKKVSRKNIDMSQESIKQNIHDIVGTRVICSFRSDIYKISEMIQMQKDITVVDFKDYIKNPKPNGYQSLHLILSIPVLLSDREEQVFVEIQIRTVAMDFWASLEHKIYYKYNKTIPENLTKELTNAASIANELDHRMEQIHKEVGNIKGLEDTEDEFDFLQMINDNTNHLTTTFLKSFIREE